MPNRIVIPPQGSTGSITIHTTGQNTGTVTLQSNTPGNRNLGTNPVYGPTGNGIASINKTGTDGLIDTYTITFTNGTTTQFTVTNGRSILSVSKTGTSDLVDTYTILFNDNTTQTFTVTNGEKGDTGDSGVYVGTTEPENEDVKVWLNPDGTQSAISDLVDDTETNPIDKADTLTGLTASVNELNFVDGVTSPIQTQLDGKEDTISDLSDIRTGAGLGATAVQPSDLATVATSGDYDDLINTPTIPTVNNATLTIQKNGVDVQTFTANASTNATANIIVPTDTGDLTNNAGYIKGITSGDVTTALGYTPYNSTNPSGYQANVIEGVQVNGTDLTPTNKKVNVQVPTNNNQLTNGAGYITGINSTDVTNALGYTPVDSNDLAAVATSGDYYDLTNTPSIPTSADYWTVGTSGVSDYQTTYSKKMIFYKQSNSQDNGFRIIADTDVPPLNQNGAWSGRCLIGNEKRTFLLGTARNGASTNQSICGIGAHTWGSASSQTSAGWDNIYIQPDGATSVYIGGYSWRGNSGWFRVTNNSSGSAAYRTEINTGTNTATAWKKILPNNTTASNSVLFTPSVGTTHTYTYATSVNSTVTANYGTSYGYNSTAANSATALGYNAKATGASSIQIGQGTNSTANTMYVGLSSSLNVQLLDSSGKIPIGRIDLSQITGYDATVAQTLRHSANGSIEWVND